MGMGESYTDRRMNEEEYFKNIINKTAESDWNLTLHLSLPLSRASYLAFHHSPIVFPAALCFPFAPIL